jgi:hypothetical protein
MKGKFIFICLSLLFNSSKLKKVIRKLKIMMNKVIRLMKDIEKGKHKTFYYFFIKFNMNMKIKSFLDFTNKELV